LRAMSQAWPISTAWPRCRPSKLPIARTAPGGWFERGPGCRTIRITEAEIAQFSWPANCVEDSSTSERRIARRAGGGAAEKSGYSERVSPAASEAAAPLREAGYYAVPSRRLRRRTVAAKLMLGEPILIGRNSAGAPFALRDLCPHRGMPLSA